MHRIKFYLIHDIGGRVERWLKKKIYFWKIEPVRNVKVFRQECK